MSNASTQVAASKPSALLERVAEVSLAAAAGTVPQGALIGRNSAGYFVNADNTASLTEIGLNLSVTQKVNSADADGTYKAKIERGIVVPLKIATLTTDAAARAQYGKPVYALYNDEVTLQRGTGTYENFVGTIVGHNSVTEVLVFIPLCPQGTVDFSRITPQATDTDGSLVTTGNNWIAHSVASSCAFKLLCSYTAGSGEFATMRIRARSNSAFPVVGGNFSASAGQNDYGNLSALQGYGQPGAYTQASASNIVNAVYGCNQFAAASVGRDWTAWFDTHMTVKASGGSYLMRLSHNGTVANDGAITIYGGGRLPYLLNIEDATPGFTDNTAHGSTAAGRAALNHNGSVKYLHLFSD